MFKRKTNERKKERERETKKYVLYIDACKR